MTLNESGRITPLLDRVYCRARQDRGPGNRGDAAYRSILADEDTQGDIALDAGQSGHVGILRRNRIYEAFLLVCGIDPYPSPEEEIEEARDLGNVRQVAHGRGRFLALRTVPQFGGWKRGSLAGRESWRSRCQSACIANFDSTASRIRPYAAINFLSDDIAATTREVRSSENMTNVDVAASSAQHRRPMHITCKDLAARGSSAEPTRCISHTNVAACRLKTGCEGHVCKG